MQIKNRFTGAIIIDREAKTIKELVEYCVKNKISLFQADLSGSDLSDSTLSGSDLSESNLSDSNLSGSDLRSSNLSNSNLSYSNMRSSNLSGCDLSDSNLSGCDLSDSNLSDSNLGGSNLRGSNLSGSNLSYSNFSDSNLSDSNLSGSNLRSSTLSGSNLSYSNLSYSNLRNSNLGDSDLSYSNLSGSDLSYSNLSGSDLRGSNLRNSKGLIKIMGVEKGNYYYKRIGESLINNRYRFKVGFNTLGEGEIFNNDERVLCSYPGFHFASRSWCALNYPGRPYEAKIRIPDDAQINEPWATDGKASADKIEIVQVIDTRTGEDVTEKFK